MIDFGSGFVLNLEQYLNRVTFFFDSVGLGNTVLVRSE